MGPKWRTFRTSLFSALGLAGVVPAVHYGLTSAFTDYPNPVYLLLVMAALYLFGATLFAARIPERGQWVKKGTFDTWGHSHQLFHLFCVAAAVVHYYNCHQTIIYRMDHGSHPVNFC